MWNHPGQSQILYFKGTGCAACTSLLPKITEMVATRFEKMQLHVIETEMAPSTAAGWHVFSVPTVIVVFEGKEVLRRGSFTSMVQLEAEIGRYYQLYYHSQGSEIV